MKQIVNEDYAPIFNPPRQIRYIINMGGRSAGRSYAVSQMVLAKLVAPEYFRCAIMRFVLNDVRNSIFQEVLDRIEEDEEAKNDVQVREHLLTFLHGQNKVVGLGFRKSSSDQRSKLKSLASFNVIVIEEGDEVAEDDFQQLDDSIRTMKGDILIIINLNPPHKNHWIIKRWFNLEQAKDEQGNPIEGFYIPKLKESETHNAIFIHTDYLGNIVNISQSTRLNFENYRLKNPDHYWGMIRGFVSEGKKGRIFKTWTKVSAQEFEALPYSSYYGLDFGFTNSPAALVEIKEHNDNVWFREIIYRTGLINKALSTEMENKGVSKDAIIYADSAEPKSIAELESYGWNIVPTIKGQDSVTTGVHFLLGKNVAYTEDSENVKVEEQEYSWALDRNKEPLNVPIDDFNHAIDAVRGAVHTKFIQGEEYIGFV